MSEPRQIRSFHVVFSLERRIHRIDQFRIPLPYGLPLRSVGYAAALVVVVSAIGRLPGLGVVVGGLPAPFRLVVVPLVGSVALTKVKVDGRPAGCAGWAAVRHLVAARCVCRWGALGPRGVRFGDVTITPDGSGRVLRRGRVTGPCTVHIVRPASVKRTRRGVVIHRSAGSGVGVVEPVVVAAGERLVVR